MDQTSPTSDAIPRAPAPHTRPQLALVEARFRLVHPAREIPQDWRAALDAPALIHTLALTLHAAGAERHAARLHEGWALLRDSGVTTAGHGQSGAPYASEVSDSAFIAMLCRGEAVSKRPQQVWHALHNDKNTSAGSQTAFLRVVS